MDLCWRLLWQKLDQLWSKRARNLQIREYPLQLEHNVLMFATSAGAKIAKELGLLTAIYLGDGDQKVSGFVDRDRSWHHDLSSNAAGDIDRAFAVLAEMLRELINENLLILRRECHSAGSTFWGRGKAGTLHAAVCKVGHQVRTWDGVPECLDNVGE